MEFYELFHLRAEAVPIGMFVDTQFAATKFQLAKDDILVAYTDGITEAANASGELWGLERLECLLRTVMPDRELGSDNNIDDETRRAPESCFVFLSVLGASVAIPRVTPASDPLASRGGPGENSRPARPSTGISLTPP